MKRFKLSLCLCLCLCLLILAPLSSAQTCNPNSIADAPNSRYATNANGTVTDKKTGLIWMRCALGQLWNKPACKGTEQTYTWQAALQAADSTVFSGHSDWRLPNVKELQSLMETRCYDPSINITAFPNAASTGFWSSSPYANNSSYAWFVYFYLGNGYYDLKNNHYAVRLVRGGQ